MKTQNLVQLIGYVGADPIRRSSITGNPLARFKLATDYFRRTDDGTVIRKTTWHHVIAWDAMAENVMTQCGKGSHLLVQGEIRYRSYQNKEGHKVHTTEIRLQTLINLDR